MSVSPQTGLLLTCMPVKTRRSAEANPGEPRAAPLRAVRHARAPSRDRPAVAPSPLATCSPPPLSARLVPLLALGDIVALERSPAARPHPRPHQRPRVFLLALYAAFSRNLSGRPTACLWCFRLQLASRSGCLSTPTIAYLRLLLRSLPPANPWGCPRGRGAAPAGAPRLPRPW